MEKTYSFQKLADYIWAFCAELQLFKGHDCLAIALSGGMDSRLLLEVAINWREQCRVRQVHALHFNHGVRTEALDDEVFVRSLCQRLQVELTVGHSEHPVARENELRRARHDFFKAHLKANEILLLGHHLDDSFEWSLRQMARTSELKSLLGMPAMSGYLRRPLMCLARHQIEYACQQFELGYCHDQSNDSTLYERNFIRHQIVPPLKKLSPALLKNYVARSEQLAQKLGLCLRSKVQQQSRSRVYADRHIEGVIHLLWPKQLGAVAVGPETIFTILKRLSQSERGMWRDQVQKLLRAISKGWAGPFSFSGGVRALIVPGRLIFYSERSEEQFKQVVNDSSREWMRFKADSHEYWLYRYRAIDFSDYPQVKRGHILSEWGRDQGDCVLVTHEQLQALPVKKQCSLELCPVC